MRRTENLILSAFFAALTAILSQLVIPIAPVPINMALLSVFMAGRLLGPRYGALSQLIYLLVGAAGAPVFSLMRGGLWVLAGPTGGYILGYIPAAYIAGLNSERAGARDSALYISLGLAVCYIFGTTWFCIVTGTGPVAALAACVLPFLPGDALKIIASATLSSRLSPFIERRRGRV